MLLGDLGWGRLVLLQSALGAAAQGPAMAERSPLLWCPDGQNPGHGESTLTSLLPLPETAPGSINIVISIIQMVALGVATMEKFISFSENTRVSSFSPDCNATEKSERRTHEHGTYSVQMPTKTRTSRCHFLGINEETKAVTSIVSPNLKATTAAAEGLCPQMAEGKQSLFVLREMPEHKPASSASNHHAQTRVLL